MSLNFIGLFAEIGGIKLCFEDLFKYGYKKELTA
jgi:hypothetical protein